MRHDLGVTPLCEGIETEGEARVLEELGVRLMQGYFFARPSFEALAQPAPGSMTLGQPAFAQMRTAH